MSPGTIRKDHTLLWRGVEFFEVRTYSEKALSSAQD